MFVPTFCIRKMAWITSSKKINAVNTKNNQLNLLLKTDAKCNRLMRKLKSIRGIKFARWTDGRVTSARISKNRLTQVRVNLKHAMRKRKRRNQLLKTDAKCNRLMPKLKSIRGIKFARWTDGRVTSARISKNRLTQVRVNLKHAMRKQKRRSQLNRIVICFGLNWKRIKLSSILIAEREIHGRLWCARWIKNLTKH